MTSAGTDVSLRAGLKPVLVVGFISAVAGAVIVLQDAVLAAWFAAGTAADAYQLAISFPLMALNVFSGGTLLAVMVPELVHLDVSGRAADVGAFLRQSRRALAALLLLVCAVWAVSYPTIARAVAKDFSAETIALSTRLLWIALPVLLVSGLAGVEIAVLNSQHRFTLLSTLPAFMPAGVALSVLLFGSRVGIVAAPIGLLAGSAAQWLVARRGTTPLPGRFDPAARSHASLRELSVAYGAAAASAALLAGILLVDTFMASTLGPGRTATFGYATRPIILLLAFATTVVGNVTLPVFARLAAADDRRALKKHLISWCGLLALAAAPVVAFSYWYAADIVAFLFERGVFKPSDTANVAAVLQIYVLQLPFYLVGMMGWRVMNSLRRHRLLLAITAVAFSVNLSLDLWLAPRLGLAGIAWGTNAAFASWAVLIALALFLFHGDGQTRRKPIGSPVLP